MTDASLRVLTERWEQAAKAQTSANARMILEGCASQLRDALTARPDVGVLTESRSPEPRPEPPRKIPEMELDRISQIIGDTHWNKPLFDNVPSDLSWGELIQCVSDLLAQGVRAGASGGPENER